MKSIRRKIIILCLLFFSMGIGTACSKQKTEESIAEGMEGKPMIDPSMPADNTYHPETDFQYSWGLDEKRSFQRAPEGIYHQGGYRLYIIDETTMEPKLCCSRPDCPHEWRLESCSANIAGITSGFGYMNGLFYFDSRKSNFLNRPEKEEYAFYSMDTTGNQRKELFDYPQSGSYNLWLVHRGYLYSYFYEVTGSGQEGILRITQTSLSDPAQIRVLWERKTSSYGLKLLSAYGNYLIFSWMAWDGPAIAEIYSLNLQTGQLKQCPAEEEGGPNFMQLAGDRILITMQNHEKKWYVSCSLDFEEWFTYPDLEMSEEEQREKEPFVVQADFQYLYKDSNYKDGHYEGMDILDLKGNKIDTVDLSPLKEVTWFEDMNALVLSDPKEDGVVFLVNPQLNWGFYYFKKSEIGSGNIQVKPLMGVCSTYDYIPPEEVDMSDWR